MSALITIASGRVAGQFFHDQQFSGVCNREVGPLVGENHGGWEHGRGSQHPSHAPWSPGEVAGCFT